MESTSEPGVKYIVLVPLPDDDVDSFICECPGFIYRGHCKHQAVVSDNICRWDETIGPETQTTEGECPRCGEETIESLEIE